MNLVGRLAGSVLVIAGLVATEGVRCTVDDDCSLNGACTAGRCVCDPGWTTLPFGPNNSLTPGCGYLDFLPSPITECGDACAFHGGSGGVDRKTTSWGGSVLHQDGKYWMFAAEMANQCTLGQWTTNSQVVNAVSSSPLGPFVRQGIAIPPWSHNPQAVRAPDGTYVIYTLGPGFGLKKERNCTKQSTAVKARATCGAPEQDTDLDGNDLAQACGFKASSAADCCKLCDGHPKCSSYTFMPAASTCCLKTAGAAGARRIAGYQSGVVRPPAAPLAVNFTVHMAHGPDIAYPHDASLRFHINGRPRI